MQAHRYVLFATVAVPVLGLWRNDLQDYIWSHSKTTLTILSDGFQDLADARVSVKDLRARSMVQVRGHEYTVHDLLLDFVRSKIKEDDLAKETFTRRQAQYLGSVEVFTAYSDKGEIHRGFHSLLALWRSLKDLSCDDRLDASTYATTLSELEQRGASWETAHTFGAVARLFDLQVSPHVVVAPNLLRRVHINIFICARTVRYRFWREWNHLALKSRYFVVLVRFRSRPDSAVTVRKFVYTRMSGSCCLF